MENWLNCKVNYLVTGQQYDWHELFLIFQEIFLKTEYLMCWVGGTVPISSFGM